MYYEFILMVYAFISSSSHPIVVNHNICTLFRIFIIIIIYVIVRLVHHWYTICFEFENYRLGITLTMYILTNRQTIYFGDIVILAY